MAGMQLIIPPCEDTKSHQHEHGKADYKKEGRDSLASNHNQCLKKQDDALPQESHFSAPSSSNDFSRRNPTSGILPSGMRENFQAILAIRRKLGRGNVDDKEGGARDCESFHNDDVMAGLKRKERSEATEAALAIDLEITRWQNGIAELESMLKMVDDEEGSYQDSAEEGRGGQMQQDLSNEEDLRNGRDRESRQRPPRVIRFPHLPPIIPLEDDDTCLGSDGSVNSSRRNVGTAASSGHEE